MADVVTSVLCTVTFVYLRVVSSVYKCGLGFVSFVK